MTTSRKRRWPMPLAILYAAYAWLAFLGCVLVAIVGALLLPGLERRRRWVTASARASLLLCAIPARIDGMERLPQGHCIVVANHASYLDGVILQAFLPPRFSYVIKGEMQNVPVVHFLLRRIGAKFVERFVASGSARDARALLKAAAAGESLAFFPEGTFVSQPGLGRFRSGAFAAAIKGELPIVPLVIVGARKRIAWRHADAGTRPTDDPCPRCHSACGCCFRQQLRTGRNRETAHFPGVRRTRSAEVIRSIPAAVARQLLDTGK